MVKEACKAACQTEARQVVAIVQETNVRAMAFYSSIGFRETGATVEKMGARFLIIAYSPS